MRRMPRTPLIRRTDRLGFDVVTAPDIWWVEVGDDALTLRVDREVYSDEAIFRTCYLFTDRCYLWLDRDGPDHLVVRFRKRTDADLTHIVGEFGNELINQRLRIALARETHDIRKLIVTRAFADADFTDQ